MTAPAISTNAPLPSTNKIKKALTGAGHADKSAVDKMVQILLPNAHPKTPDEADAIAIALAHTNMVQFIK